MQKFKIPLLVTGVLLVLVATYFLFIRSAGIYQGIPASAMAVIEVNNWNKLADKLSITATGAELKKTAAVQKLMAEVTLLQQLVSADKSLKENMASSNTVASLHLTSASDYDFLFTTALSGVNDNTLLNHIQTSPLVRSVSVHIFKTQKIIDVRLKDGQLLSFAKRKNLLACSFTTFLTENSIAALISGDNLQSDRHFKVVCARLSATGDLNLFVNLQRAEVIFPVAFKPTKISLLQDIKNAGAWARYELSLSNDKLDLDGVISTAEETNDETKDLLEENLLSNVPDHAAYLQLTQSAPVTKGMLSPYFTNWMGNTKAFAILEPLNEKFTDQNIFILSIKDKAKAKESLKALIARSRTTTTPVDTFSNYEIYNLPDGATINQVFGNSLVLFKNTFFAFTPNAALFCNNIDVLKLSLEKITKAETIDRDANFLATGYTHYGMNSGLQYINFQRSDLMLQGILQQNSTLLPLLSSFKQVLGIYNFKEKKGFSHFTFYTGGQSRSASGLVWKTRLKAAALSKPQLVLNPSTGENEIFVQDTANNIYLISQSGEILFTKNIGEPVLGNVYQLDYYNNDKLQYIFNSPQHVFIIDRLGYDVGSYPLRLSSTATAGLTLVKTGALNRYYVPCANGCIYGYEGNGKPLPAWSPKSGVGILDKPVQYVNTGKSDFFVCFNNSGRLILLDNKANVKWSIDNLPLAAQNFAVVQQAGNIKLLNATDTRLTEIVWNGNDRIIPLIDSAEAFTAYSGADSGYTYYFCTGAQIRAYNHSDEFKNATSAAGLHFSKLKIISMAGQAFLQATDEQARQFVIYTTDLKEVARFNYSSASSTAIGDLFSRQQFMVIATDTTGSLNCYRIK